jgi:hypothetical protein
MFENLLIDLIGLTLVGLCVAVCVVPSARRPSGYARDI